jgi:hypothetical protein
MKAEHKRLAIVRYSYHLFRFPGFEPTKEGGMEEFEFLQAHDAHEKHINHRSAASSKGDLQQRA